MEIWREFKFDAAHRLPHVPAGHKCARLHGHTYITEIHVTGELDSRSGWVIDYADIADAFAPFLARLDHHYLNELEGGLENPTTENLARWIWDRLSTSLVLSAVVVREGQSTGCVYRGK